jgi:hypothetical protein
MQSLIDALVPLAPVIAAAIASVGLSLAREHIAPVIAPKWYPVLLPIAGGLVASAARFFGVDIGDLNPETADLDAWQTAVAGVMTGGLMVGLHQIPKQLSKPE